MIAKLVKRKKGRSSYRRLVSYLLDAQGKDHRVVQARATNLYNDQVQDPLGLACALAEVEQLQARNTRGGDKTMHLLLSFHEDLDLATMHDIEQRVVDGLGFGAHQRISVIHGDTRNPHIHIAINRVHRVATKRGDRYLCRHLDFGKLKLGALATRMELDFGLVPDDHGLTRWQQQDHSNLNERLQQLRPHLVPALTQASNWTEFKAIASHHGLTLRTTGKTGLKFVDRDKATFAASKLSKKLARTALERRLGPLPPSITDRGTPTTRPTQPRALTLTQRLKPTVASAFKQANSWAEIHAIAATHGLRLLERGGGLSIEDLATGELTSASAVTNQLSLGRATKRLGPYQASPDLSAIAQAREQAVSKASEQATRDHRRRTARIQTGLPHNTPQAPWLAASKRRYEADQQRLKALHKAYYTQEFPNRTAQTTKPSRQHQAPNRVATKLAELAQLIAQGFHHGQRRRSPHQPHRSLTAAPTAAQPHSLHRMPQRPVVRPAAEPAVLLPRDASGELQQRAAGGEGREL